MLHDRANGIEFASNRLAVAVRQSGQAIRIGLAGELDLSGRPAAERAIAEALERHPRELVLDFSRLTFTDATGVHVVLSATKLAAAGRTDLTLIPGPPPVQRVFTLAGAIHQRFAFSWARVNQRAS